MNYAPDERRRPVGPAPIPLCFCNIFDDGQWSDAAPAWDTFGNADGAVRAAVAVMLELRLVTMPAIAVRMSDESLVIVRPLDAAKKAP